jgi:hypothetical protein
MRLSRVQFSLSGALFAIVFIAVYFAQIRTLLGLGQHVSTIVLEALDGDEKSLAIDEIGFNIHPVLLGTGIPLFHPMSRQIDLELRECRPLKNGCVYLSYRVKH